MRSGSKVTVVELLDQIIPGADKDIVAPLAKRIEKRYEKILLKTKVVAVRREADGLRVTFEGADGPKPSDVFDKLLVSVGRKPERQEHRRRTAGVKVNDRGFIPVGQADAHQRAAHLRHRRRHRPADAGAQGGARRQGRGRVACGHKSPFDAKVIPWVAYTDPEVAWVGVTENEAKAQGLEYGKASFPWAASGRALSLGRDEGVTKLLFDAETKRLIGCGIVGPNAGDLIAEAALAIEMGADAEDIGLTIHPHPTLSETIGLAAEMFEGTITDLIAPKKK